MDQALAVAQHHDAVTGTEKQHVNDDYIRRLAEGASAMDSEVSNILNEMRGSASNN